jgi:hypothetical protein
MSLPQLFLKKKKIKDRGCVICISSNSGNYGA